MIKKSYLQFTVLAFLYDKFIIIYDNENKGLFPPALLAKARSKYSLEVSEAIPPDSAIEQAFALVFVAAVESKTECELTHRIC
jgi:hypothetical protein